MTTIITECKVELHSLLPLLVIPSFSFFFPLPRSFSLPTDLTALSEGDPVPLPLEGRVLHWLLEHDGCCLSPSPSAGGAG